MILKTEEITLSKEENKISLKYNIYFTTHERTQAFHDYRGSPTFLGVLSESSTF